MKKILVLSALILGFALENQSLYAQTSTTVEELYAANYLTGLLSEYHDIFFSIAATSIDHSIPGLHGFNSSESTSQGWVFNNLRLTFAVGTKFIIPTINLQSVFRGINKSDQVSHNPKPFITGVLDEVSLGRNNPLRTTITRIPYYIPFASFSFGRIGLGKNRSPIENLLFTIQYGGNLSFLNFDDTFEKALVSDFTNSLSIANISFQYAVYETGILQFQTIASFGYSHTRFSGTINNNDDDTLTIPANPPIYTNTNTAYTLRQNPNTNSRTYLNHSLYSLQLATRGEFNIKHFSIFFQAKLLFKLYEDYDGYSELNYIVFQNSGTGASSQLTEVTLVNQHNYLRKSVVIPSVLVGVSIFRTVNISFEVSLFQASSFTSYFGAGVSLDIAL